MARVSQGIVIKKATLKNPGAKFKLNYTFINQMTIANGIAQLKYTYSKLITPSAKKYSYN